MKLNLHRHLDLSRFGRLPSPSALIALSTITAVTVGLAILSMPAVVMAATIVVNPGESIQAAVDAASAGDKIVVKPGTYMETHGGINAVTVNKSGIKLIAKSNIKKGKRVILVPGPGNLHGIIAAPDPGQPDLEKYLIKGFTVQGFPNNGIKLDHVNNFKIIGNESIDNLEHGIQPELSANGLVKKNVSYGSQDASLWVEGVEHVRILKNSLHDSPTGLEVTVSNDVLIKKNDIFNNSLGIGLFHPSAAPNPPLPVMKDWKVQKNTVHDNNMPNPVTTGMVAGIPAGGGILILGVDFATIDRNDVQNNDFFGVGIVDYCLANAGTPFNCTDNPPAVEPVPNFNRISRNTFVNNGTAPDPTHPLAPFAADMVNIVFDPSPGNCFTQNTFATYASLTGGGPHQCP